MADILIFSAHPDDADFAMGGTLLKLCRKFSVVNVILTRGESGTYGTPKEREAEARAAGKYANAEVEFLDFIDNHVEDTAENAKRIASIIRLHKPRVVFAPHHTNDGHHNDGRAHPDHLALGRLAVKACRFAKFRNAQIPGEAHNVRALVHFILPVQLQPSFVVDVSDAVKDLDGLWDCYKSQLSIKDGRIKEMLLIDRRRLGLHSGCDYAEGFFIDRPLLLDLDGLGNI